MNDQSKQSMDVDLKEGLPMVAAADPESLARENAFLERLAKKPLLSRWWGYLHLSGPGWMQSAMTLGSGSAMASLFAGAFLQYKLLWVQPIAMLLGIVMLSAMSYQTLTTRMRPFDAMRQYAHPIIGWTWGIGALVVTVIWHLPQYALAAGMTEDMIKAATKWQYGSTEQTYVLLGIGLFLLVISTWITWSYGKGHGGVRLYETALKLLIWMIIVAFGVVVIRQTINGSVRWSDVGKGFLPLYIPKDARGVSVMMGGFSAAVGINMTFLFPYSLLARHWGREHRGLGRFDLFTGMLLPYCIATGLMVIATGCMIYNPEKFAEGATILKPVEAAKMLEGAGLSPVFSRYIFGFGIVGMALSSITLQMLAGGFAACEIFHWKPTGWRYRLACLIPAPAVVGVLFWQKWGAWVAVPTSAICGLMLPIAYIGFFILNNSKKFLGDDKPTGPKAWLWNGAMLIAIGVSITTAIYYVVAHWSYLMKIFS